MTILLIFNALTSAFIVCRVANCLSRGAKCAIVITLTAASNARSFVLARRHYSRKLSSALISALALQRKVLFVAVSDALLKQLGWRDLDLEFTIEFIFHAVVEATISLGNANFRRCLSLSPAYCEFVLAFGAAFTGLATDKTYHHKGCCQENLLYHNIIINLL